MGITVDTSGAPLLRVTFAGTLDDDAFNAYLAEYRAFLGRGMRYAIVIDASTSGVPSPAQRRLLADSIRDDRPRLRAQCVGGAFVISSTLVRGALTAVLWLQPLPFEYVLVKDVDAAERWCRERLNDTVADQVKA